MSHHLSRLVALLALTGLVACGGGGGGDADINATSVVVQDATAVDGLARFNFWRQQIGLSPLVRNTKLDAAAQGHSDYQAINRTITHYQTEGKTGFTGVCLGDSGQDPQCPAVKVSRLETAAYQFTQPSYAFGEVISRTSSTSGADAADALITAIYHRFVVFEPMFKEVGVGAASLSGGPTYFTANFTADGLDAGVGRGNIVVYPGRNQLDVPRNFFSDQEVPDPVPNRNEVGYPISVHADIFSNREVVINVQSFTVKPQGGSNLAVRQLWSGVDSNTPPSAAAIVPLDVLAANTTYEVQFTGTVDGLPVVDTWSFTTRP